MSKKDPSIVYASTRQGIFTTMVEGLIFTIEQQIEVDELDKFEPDLKEMKEIKAKLETLGNIQVGVVCKDLLGIDKAGQKRLDNCGIVIIHMTFPVWNRLNGVMKIASNLQMMGFFQ